jgi:hypothetical protein
VVKKMVEVVVRYWEQQQREGSDNKHRQVGGMLLKRRRKEVGEALLFILRTVVLFARNCSIMVATLPAGYHRDNPNMATSISTSFPGPRMRDIRTASSRW